MNHIQECIENFVSSEEYEQLGIGEYAGYSVLKSFERPFSIFTLVRLRGKKGSKNLYIKVFKNFYQVSQEEFETAIRNDFETSLFWYKRFQYFEEFATFRPIYCSIPHRMIITEECKGVNLNDLIERYAKFYSPADEFRRLLFYVKQVGKLLRTFQNFYQGSEVYDLRLLVEDVDIRLKKLVDNPHSRFTEQDRQKILNFYDSHLAIANRKPIPMKYVHSDFGPSNILVNGDKIILHDFQEVKIAPFLWDLTRFYHQLELFRYKPYWYPTSKIRKLQAAYLQGYGCIMGIQDIRFRFFLLRNYFTHYVGVARLDGLPFLSKWYNKWVIYVHKKNINKLIKME